MPSVSSETPSTRWLSLCEFTGLIPRVTLRSPWALLYRAVGTGFRFISAFTDGLVLCTPSDFFKSVFQFSSIFCLVLAQTVDEPFFFMLFAPVIVILYKGIFQYGNSRKAEISIKYQKIHFFLLLSIVQKTKQN